MSNGSTSAYAGACRKDIPYPSVSHESVPSLIDNLVAALYGSITKTVVNRRVQWNIPCDPNNSASVAGIPRNAGEGLLCYIMRVFNQFISGGTEVFSPFLNWTFTGNGSTTTYQIPSATATLPSAYLVYIDGVVQAPSNYYIASGNPFTIVFSTAIPNGSQVVIVCMGTASTGEISSASVVATGSTTPRTLANRFADVVNVKDFGAIGDGVTDDTAAIQAAIDQAGSQGGGSVFFPAGQYLISATLSITQPNIALFGDALECSYINRSSNFTGGTIYAKAPTSSLLQNIGIYNLSIFDINGSMTNGAHITLDWVAFATIENVRIRDGHSGVALLGAQNIYLNGRLDWRITSNPSSSIGRYGLLAGATTVAGTYQLHGGDIWITGTLNCYGGNFFSTQYALDDIIRVDMVDGLYFDGDLHGIFYQRGGLTFLPNNINQLSNVSGDFFGDYGNGPAVYASGAGILQQVVVTALTPAQEPIISCSQDSKCWITRSPIRINKTAVTASSWSVNPVPAKEETYCNIFITQNLTTTSSSSLTINNSQKTLTVGTGLSWYQGLQVIISYNSTNYIVGWVNSYNSSTGVMVVNVTSIVGSGTYSSWNVYNPTGSPLSGDFIAISLDSSTGGFLLSSEAANSTATVVAFNTNSISTAPPSGNLIGFCQRIY
jgi:hypothetical protein